MKSAKGKTEKGIPVSYWIARGGGIPPDKRDNGADECQWYTDEKKKEDEEGSNVALLPSITFGTSIDYDLYWLTGYKRQQFLPTFTFFLFVVLSYFK